MDVFLGVVGIGVVGGVIIATMLIIFGREPV